VQLTQEIPIDSPPGPTFEGYNPDKDHQFMIDDHSFNTNYADMSSYMPSDPTDSDMLPSSLHLTNPLASDVALDPTANSNGCSVNGQDTLGADFEGWPCFVCNPPSGERINPKIGRMFLEGLEHTLEHYDTMRPSTLLLGGDRDSRAFNAETCIEPFSGRARDKLLVITQSILHKARKIHGTSTRELGNNEDQLPDTPTSYEVFSILPSTDDLEHLLQSYANRFEPYNSSVPSRLLSPMAILESTEERCSSLLLLLMFALGAMATPTNEARCFTSGLTESCRLSWFGLVEKDVSLARDPIMLRSALMFINIAAWSGDKWHMDVSLLPQSISFCMLRKISLLLPNLISTYP